MSNKLVMVTGANSGIGRAAAVELASLGAEVVMVCRDRERGEEARRQVASRGDPRKVELLTADLSLLSEVRALASAFLAGHPRLDVLINNAGSVFTGYRETPEALERTMALNYFSPFLLTNLLLPCLLAGAPSRVVNVASVSHFGGRLNLEDINGKRSARLFGLRAYSNSKLALVLFTYELARRMRGRGVTSNCLHPGAVRTGIWSHSGPARPFTLLASLFMKSPRRGAETVVYLASSPEVEAASGEYFVDMAPRRSAAATYDQSLAGNLWALSERVTGLGRRNSDGFA